jgi:hypothetical protein
MSNSEESSHHKDTLNSLDLEGLPENFPYAVLTADRVDLEILRRVALTFELDFSSTSLASGAARFRILCRNRNSGQHKIQTLTLTAASLAIMTACPGAGLRLDIQSDFRSALTGRKDEKDLKPPNDDGLWLDEASQLYLTQTGFILDVAPTGVFLGPEELRTVAVTFLSRAAQSRHRIGA